jgi:hypothetical protein
MMETFDNLIAASTICQHWRHSYFCSNFLQFRYRKWFGVVSIAFHMRLFVRVCVCAWAWACDDFIIVPGPVGHLAVTNRGSRQILIGWEPPTELNGRFIGYTLTYRGWKCLLIHILVNKTYSYLCHELFIT